MVRYALLIIFCILHSALGQSTFQLISFTITSNRQDNETYAIMNRVSMQALSLQRNGSAVGVTASGDYRAGDGFVITPHDGTATIGDASAANWSLVYTASFLDFENRTKTQGPSFPVLNFTCTITNAFAPKDGNNSMLISKNDKVSLTWKLTTLGVPDLSLASFPPNATVEIRYFMAKTTENKPQDTVKKGNKAAVAAAIIEGIILFVILLLLLYWLFIVRPRQRQMNAFGTGFTGNDPYAANRNIGGGASARPPAYGSSPIRVEMQDRTPPSSNTPATRPAGLSDSDRVQQTSRADNVAVPRDNVDPLSQWPDQQRR